MPSAGALIKATDVEPDAWIAYTPSINGSGSPTVGNGTLTARYRQVQKTVHYTFTLVAGSTTNFGGGTFWITLPVAARAITPETCGFGFVIDSSTSTRKLVTAQLDSATNQFIMITTDSTICANTAPWTWTTSDTIRVAGTYESA